jgi:hypothetical protein
MIDLAITVHLLALTDDTGLAQHARHHFVDRSHGYCLDDNARAVTVMCRLAHLRTLSATEQHALTAYAAFLDHSFDRQTRHFRNFMTYDRRWLDEEAAEDACARAVHALCVMIAMPPQEWMRVWGRDLLEAVLPRLHELASPRSWSLVLTGLDILLRNSSPWREAEQLREQLAHELLQRWRDAVQPAWPWFEDGLAYDNGRLAEAAITAGTVLGMADLRGAGLSALQALWDWQYDGQVFHPVGTHNFGRRHQLPCRFDQQPIEAHAMIDGCLAAASSGADTALWRERADIAMAWFFGRNDLGRALVEPEKGLCHDGLHEDRMNANAGAESTLAYIGAFLSMASLERQR